MAVLTAVILLLARLLRLGFIADFLSRTVLVGFLTGVGFQVGISVLSEMFGVPVDSRRPVVQLWEVGRGLPHAHLPTVILSVSVLAFVLLLRHFVPKVPGALVAVVGAIAASAAWNFAGHGIATIGPVAGGLPHLGLMALLSLREMNRKEIELLLTVSASCAVMILTQSAATARIYAAKHYEKVDENLDLYGLSAANVAGGAERRVCGEWQPHADGDDGRCRRQEPDGASGDGRGGGRGAAVSYRAAAVSAHLRAGRSGLPGRAAADQFR